VNGFLWNLLLALAWAIAAGELTVSNLLFGFILGFLVLYFTRRSLGLENYGRKVTGLIGLVMLFFWELTVASLRIAYDIVTPRHHMRPGVLAVPLEVKSDAEITLLANLITMTPGTLSLDISEDRSVLYVHTMYIGEGDLETERRNLKSGFERRIVELFR
jgi:multicomponent Na+:H+ antiporter subunit E